MQLQHNFQASLVYTARVNLFHIEYGKYFAIFGKPEVVAVNVLFLIFFEFEGFVIQCRGVRFKTLCI